MASITAASSRFILSSFRRGRPVKGRTGDCLDGRPGTRFKSTPIIVVAAGGPTSGTGLVSYMSSLKGKVLATFAALALASCGAGSGPEDIVAVGKVRDLRFLNGFHQVVVESALDGHRRTYCVNPGMFDTLYVYKDVVIRRGDLEGAKKK